MNEHDTDETRRYELIPYMKRGYGDGGYPGGGSDDSDGGGNGGDTPDRTPYPDGEPHPIPGRIQAEHFDESGEGISFHERDAPADWALDFRPATGVDVKRAPGTEDGMSVGRFRADEWLDYTVTIESGTYTLRARVGTARPDRALGVYLNEQQVAALSVPETGWDDHAIVEVTDLPIRSHAETHRLRLRPALNGVDVDWVEFERTGDIIADPPATEHATVRVAGPDGEQRVSVFGATPADIEVVAGLEPAPATTVGERPRCAAATTDGDRCTRGIDIKAGARTCWQHDAGDVPDEGW